MWNNDFAQEDMMGWESVWSWFMSLHGIFTLFAMAIIVIVCIAIYRDWRRDQLDDLRWNETRHE